MTIRAIVFDLGHTLWDITPQPDALARAYVDMRAELAHRLGRDDLPEAAALQRAVRDVLHEAAKTYFVDGPELREPPPHEWVDAACRRLGVAVEAAVLREITPPLFATEINGLVVADGVHEALSQLSQRGYRLGCITNTLADTPAIRAMLRLHGFEQMMRSVVVSTEMGWRKPHHSLFERAARELDVPSVESVFVGDSPAHDIAGARAVGMRTVLTRQYVQRPYPSAMPPPDATIDHVSELAQIVSEL